MQTITLKGYGTNIPPYEAIELGTYDSYGVEQLQIVPSHGWENLSIIASFFPPSGAEPIKVAVLSGGIIDVPPGATAKQSGKGIIVFAGYKANTQLISTNVAYNIRDHKDIASGDPVCPTPSVVDQIVNAAKSAQEDAEKAAGSAKKAEDVADSVRNDADEGKFNGEDGYSPSANVAQIENGAVISIRDKTGESTATIYNGKDGAKGDKGDTGDKGNTGAKGDKGDKGFSPTAAVTQLENGAEITITDEKGTTKATVKNGIKGDKGDRGSNGVSPTISVEDIENGHRVTIVDATGTTSVDIYNGEDGIDGKDGAQVDDSSIGDKPWSSKHIVDMLCPPLEESGNPVVCYPVAGYALGVKAKWEPVQEGTGTPYPAGGGKQLLDTNKCVPIVEKPYGMTITLDGDVFKVSGVPNEEVTATKLYSFAVCTCSQEELRGKGYKVTAWAIKGKVNSAWGLRTESENALAIAAELTPGVNNDIQLRLMVSKDTPTAWEPYENIRPMKGRDSVRVERCGANLSKISDISTPNKSLTPVELPTEIVTDIEISFDTLNAEIKNVGTAFFLNKADGKWKAITVQDFGISTAGKIPNGRKTAVFHGVTFKTVETVIIKNGYCKWSGDVNNFCVSIIQNAPYTPYTGQTNTLTLPETVYGGEVDAVSGESSRTWRTITLTGEESSYIYLRYFYLDLKMDSSFVVEKPADNITGRSSHYPYKLYADYSIGLTMDGKALTYSSNGKYPLSDEGLHEWKSYLAAQYAAGTPVQVCYKLAEPVPFTATGAQPMPALAGANTVLTDADSATVTGRADPIKRIEDLEAAVASIN